MFACVIFSLWVKVFISVWALDSKGQGKKQKNTTFYFSLLLSLFVKCKIGPFGVSHSRPIFRLNIEITTPNKYS